MKEKGELDELYINSFHKAEMIIKGTKKLEDFSDNIDTLEKSIISDVDKNQLLKELGTLRNDLDKLQKIVSEDKIELLRKGQFELRDYMNKTMDNLGFLTDERKKTLQQQIDDIKDEVKYVRKRADEKITIKDEFAGAWNNNKISQR